jgi:hypothetical protein
VFCHLPLKRQAQHGTGKADDKANGNWKPKDDSKGFIVHK